MANKNKPLEDLQSHLNGKEDLNKIQGQVAYAKAHVDNVHYTQRLQDLKTLESERAAARSLNLDHIHHEYNQRSLDDLAQYMVAAKGRMRFMLPSFDVTVPLFAHNLLLFGAVTGGGKSATCAQATFSLLNQNYLHTGRPCRVLYLTNEETRGEVYTRIACLYGGWKYSRMDLLTDTQKQFCMKFQKEMQDTGRLLVIDNQFPDIRQPTTSIEGIQCFLESVDRNKNDFNVIVVDYFNKISDSVAAPGLDPTAVLAKVCNLMDDYRRRLNCPILVFTQLWPKTSDKIAFESRIKGRKMILEPATFAAEIEIDAENYCTHFHIHKNRLVPGTVGSTITVGYDRHTGQLVEYDTEFQKRAQQWFLDEKMGNGTEDDGDANEG